MNRWMAFPLEGFVGLYLLAYLPNVIVTKLVTSFPHPGLGRPLTGLETLPASLMISLVLTYLFIWLSGWHRDANGRQIGGRRVPVPTRLQRYALARWQRVARVQARSMRNGQIFHAQGLLRVGRDASMRLLGERLLDVPWLYSR